MLGAKKLLKLRTFGKHWVRHSAPSLEGLQSFNMLMSTVKLIRTACS